MTEALSELPPFGSKRKAALALYKPPFVFRHGYIYDAENHMVADQERFNEEAQAAMIARVRGWGRIGYMPDAEALQDEVGAVIAEALTAFWNGDQAVQQARSQALADKLDAERYHYLCSFPIIPAPSLWDRGVAFATPQFTRVRGAMSKKELDEAVDAAIRSLADTAKEKTE